MNKITVSITVNAPLKTVWERWNGAEHIPHWAFADASWGTEAKENDVRTGGKFCNRLFAKDGSAEFNFEGIYDVVEEGKHIAYTMSDGRKVEVIFTETADGVTITETFDPESENSEEIQRAGWQGFLDNFKKYVEKY